MAVEQHSSNLSSRMKMRLYITDDAPNSRLARENLQSFLARFGKREITIEVIDLVSCPEKALEEGIFITPTLHVLEPAPGRMIYGNLSDQRVLEQVFGSV